MTDIFNPRATEQSNDAGRDATDQTVQDDYSFGLDPEDQVGFDQILDKDKRSGSKEQEDMQDILTSSIVNERLPMLEVVYDRFVRMLSSSMRNLTSENVEVTLRHTESRRFGEYLDTIPESSLIAVFKVEEWDNYALIVFDGVLVSTLIEVLMGGRQNRSYGGDFNQDMDKNNKYTTIERTLMRKVVETILNDLAIAFDPLSVVTMRFNRLEINARFANIARPTNATVCTELSFDLDGRGGACEILFPYATLEPIRELLLQMFMGEKFGRDSIWERHLAGELWYTHVDIRAVLAEVECDLGDVLQWEVGTLLPLGISSNDVIEVRCGAMPVFAAEMGKKGSQIALKINEVLVESQFA